MSDQIYIQSVEPEGQAQWCILQRSLIFFFMQRWQLGRDEVRAIILLLMEWELAFCSVLYMGYIAHVVTGMRCSWGGICTALCLVCRVLVCNHWSQPISEGQRPIVLVSALCEGPLCNFESINNCWQINYFISIHKIVSAIWLFIQSNIWSGGNLTTRWLFGVICQIILRMIRQNSNISYSAFFMFF